MKRSFVFLLILILALCSSCSAAQAPSASAEPVESEAPLSAASPQSAAATESPEVSVLAADPVNILLMGCMDGDFSGESQKYALTHILVTLCPAEGAVKITTFPYNLAVDVKTESGTENMQLQFVCGGFGEDATVSVIEENFGISIDHWVLMNMHGVMGIVDALGGIEIDIKELSLNEAAGHLVDMLGITWEEVTKTGLQLLTGVQTAGFFIDTVPEDQDNYAVEEERLFRDRHEKIITGVVQCVRSLKLNAAGLVEIANSLSENYATDIAEIEWESIAETALLCTGNDPQFLHVPQTIKTDEDGGLDLVYDTEADVLAVKQFIGQ